ncbi:LIM domain [Popillia japonica]
MEENLHREPLNRGFDHSAGDAHDHQSPEQIPTDGPETAEENLHREPLNLGPKPLKRFTPPPEPARPESGSEADGSESEEDSEPLEEVDQSKLQDADLLEAQKAARARQLRAKFEKWEAKEIKREQQQVNIIEDMGEDQSQVESTKALRARFESLKESQSQVKTSSPRVKVNRFV